MPIIEGSGAHHRGQVPISEGSGAQDVRSPTASSLLVMSLSGSVLSGSVDASAGSGASAAAGNIAAAAALASYQGLVDIPSPRTPTHLEPSSLEREREGDVHVYQAVSGLRPGPRVRAMETRPQI
jgi:hypothetical protein